MGIRFSCPNGHKLNVKTFLAGKRGVCPQCGAKFVIPTLSELGIGDMAQAGAAGQANSVEIISSTATPSVSVTASPSIIIAVADTTASTPSVAPDTAVITGAPELTATGIPPVPLAAAPEPLNVSNPAEVVRESQNLIQRKRRRRNQVALSIVLFVLAIVLAIVLYLVLKRSIN